MEKFAKSILNYFATYSETRFNFQKKVDYKWTDDHLTAEFSVYPDFQKKIINTIKNKEVLNISIKKGEYVVSLDENIFKGELLEHLEKEFNLEYIQSCLEQVHDKLIKTESDKVILSGADQNEKSKNQVKPNKEFDKKVLHEGLRVFNLAFRDAVKKILSNLQKQKREALAAELKVESLPLTSFNPNIIEQELYDLLKEGTYKTSDVKSFYEEAKNIIKNKSWHLEIYDLYSIIRKFMTFVGFGSPYVFFHEITSSDNTAAPTEKYPLFLIELDIQETSNEVVLRSNRNVLFINTPAINSFGFDTILTTPRAARLEEATEYLWGVERFLQNNYDFFNSFLLEYAFNPLTSVNRPTINYRIGLQCIQKENRKLLDYSELITRIDAGQGGKFIDFVKNYVSGNVKNTTDEVDLDYSKRYPRKSVNNLLSTIPLSLNKAQKRILIALENDKNKIVVVDGPPGTGKSYTIAAITYWANLQNKSVVITSHKKAALDVIDRMLTDKFRELHPKAKPSVLRISQNGNGINTFQNTLSGPVISASNSRVNAFNEEAVKKDIDNWNRSVESDVNAYWDDSLNYKDITEKLFKFEQLENELKQSGIIKEDVCIPRIEGDKILDVQLIKSFLDNLEKSKISSLSIEQLSYLYENQQLIDQLLDICNILNNTTVDISDISNLKNISNENIEDFSSLLSNIEAYVKENSSTFLKPEDLKIKFKYLFGKKKETIEFLTPIISKLKSLEFENLTYNLSHLFSKNKSELSLGDLKEGIKKLKDILICQKNIEIINSAKEKLHIEEENIKIIFDFLSKVKNIIKDIKPETIDSIQILKDSFSPLLRNAEIELDNLRNLSGIFLDKGIHKNILTYIQLFIELSKSGFYNTPDKNVIREYYNSIHKNLEYINDKRFKKLNNYSGDIERINVTFNSGKRLKIEELKVLLENISCIISEPDLISQYFPMEEDSIDVLVIDEASQVSIAESISLILRAKQVVVFGDELQYGAVSAINVNAEYARQYFKEILSSYESDYLVSIDDMAKEKLSQDISRAIDEEEQEIETIFYKPEEGTVDWLKTFNVRTSTLNFAKAIKNYSTSLDTHFRSFPEIIDYSNEFFYKPSQIPLIINRIRTKPIGEVLRFIPVKTQGNSGNNVNLDEIEAIKQDIQQIVSNGYKGTIGIITSFREQKSRMDEVLRKELPNYYSLEKGHKLTIWFVGDVQGEERDIVYFSFVEDKKIGNGSLRNIYPIVGGTADNIRKLKMQRLNVGFSRAKDIMVFVHSMPIEEYSDTRLGDALKWYKQLLDNANDNFIVDESIFGSPAEKDLYALITNTEFYRINRNKIRIIAQFPIGKYIEETLHRYIPKYRVDFLMTLSEKGKEKSLILEYDGLEYHTKNPEIVTSHNFSQEYLDYDRERQLELESYGYNFLRINKFTLIPKDKVHTKVDVLNSLLDKKFSS